MDAEFEAYLPNEIAELDDKLELPAIDKDSLHAVLMDRLEEIAHHIAHHPYSIRHLLSLAKTEDQLQPAIAKEFDDKRNGAYEVVREDQVADNKKPDVRLLSTRGGMKAAIEIKLADNNWSILKLESALEHQLLGQYLRHESCRTGCLLLIYKGDKGFWIHPITKARMQFSDVVEHLGQLARKLELEGADDVRISVAGFDLRDPPLKKLHQ